MAQTGLGTGLSSAFTISTAAASPESTFANPRQDATAQSMASTCYQALRSGLRNCDITKNDYLLPGLVESVITVQTAKAMLPAPQMQPWIPRIFTRGRGSNSEFDNAILRARKVIAILVFSETHEKIQELLNDGITDQDLPLRRGPGPGCPFISQCGTRQFPAFQAWTEPAVDRFHQWQYRVLVPDVEIPLGTVDNVPNILLHPGCGLPFSCEQISDGTQSGYSDVFKAGLLNAPPGPSQNRKPHGPPDKRQFAIKKFFKRDDFLKERENLDKLRGNGINNPHLAQHLAVCEEIPCLIFPWADGGDLKQFWEVNKPGGAAQELDPVADIVPWSLRQMLGISRAVNDLHSINCRHGDIKPGNILHFPGEGGDLGLLKLADVGVAKVHVQTTWNRNGGTSTKASTLAYEAPEAEDPAAINAPRSRAYDLWSLGCVIIEFAQWHLHGNEGLRSFESERHPGTYRFYERINTGGGHPPTVFVHPAVDRMIANLGKHEQYRGSVLEMAVKLARDRLLVIEPSKRITAEELCRQLEGIIKGMD